MGVALPTLSTSNSEDNMNLGDKDSIRRRAFWALEDMPSPDGFSPVEIPELSTPEIERRISELPSKPSFLPSMGSLTSGLSGLANIPDSFSSRVTSSVVEEDEEEEEPVASSSSSPPSALPSESPAVIGSPFPARHRPAGLSLRPLSLSPDRLMSVAAGELPTPESAATPTKPAGLKSLTLTSFPSLTSTSPAEGGVLSGAAALHRRSVVDTPTHPSASAPFFCRASVTESTSSTSSDPFEVPRKRSSITYKSSFHGLPTSELTPTTEGRPPIGSEEIDWARHPLLTSEQHFLYQSQAALVARISELERKLSSLSQNSSHLLRGFRQLFE